MKQIFFVVGHERWGKSHTLKVLKNGNAFKRYVLINDVKIKVRTMSNDDKPFEYLPYIKTKIIKLKLLKFIITLCPNFKDKRKKSKKALDTLKKASYNMYFFVLYKKYGSDRYIELDEIKILKKYGRVHIYNESEKSEDKAKAFKKFVIRNLK
jgi:amino acid permease